MQPIHRVRSPIDAARHVLTLAAVLVVSPIPSMVADRYNYTWSLLVFLLPITVILGWFYTTEEEEIASSKKAFAWTLIPLVLMGFILNLLFADSFFVYPNPDANLGIFIPALDFWSIDWEHPIPIEEFAFYTTGFIAMLLIYIWGDETFFSRYQHRTHAARVTEATQVIQLALLPAVLALSIIAVAWICKAKWGGGGFPGYLAYLTAIPLVVTLTLYKVAAPYINWRAYAFMMLVILAQSIMWEVTLAIPQGWWGYQDDTMVGVFIRPWSNLPIEAVLVWLLATIATVVTFEAAKVLVYHPGTSVRARMLGPRK